MPTVTPAGNLVTLVAFDASGNVWPLKVDASGNLKCVRVGRSSTVEAMVTPAGKLVTPVAFDPSGVLSGLTVDVNGFLNVNAGEDLIIYQLNANIFSPAASTTYYFSSRPALAPNTTEVQHRVQLFQVGVIHQVVITWQEIGGVAGSGENISMYFRYKNTTDYLIQTVGNTNAGKTFQIADLALSLLLTDFWDIKLVCPAWVTPPTNVWLSGFLFLGI